MHRRSLLKSLAALPLSVIPARAQVSSTVEEIEVFRIKVNERGHWIVLRLKSNHGLTGIGDASHSGNDEAVLGLIKSFFERLRGNSPFQVEPFRKALLDEVMRLGRPGAVAYSALEQALYDLQGRALGVPTFTLFGGMLHERLRNYANINRATTNRTPEGFAEQAELAVKAGFHAVKLAPFDGMPSDPANAESHVERGVECVAAVRKVIGPERVLLVDGHSHFDVEKALALIPNLEQHNVGWLEELTPSIEGLAEINEATKIATAGGESIFGAAGFLRYISARAVDIVMPDVKYCGGMLELKKIAAMSEAAGLNCAPHGPASPVGNIAASHVCATMNNFLTLEMAFNEVPWRADLITPAETFHPGGFLYVPESPGFGVRLNDKVAQKYAV